MKKNEKKPKEELKEEMTPETEAETAEAQAAEETPSLEKELEESRAKCAEYLDMAQRARAEFENFRKRNQSVRADALVEGAADAVTALLPVLDNLERAVGAGGEGPFFDGVSMVLRQFNDALTSLGVTEIPCEAGQPFDPALHNAVLNGPADEEHPEGTILQVFQRGFSYKGKTLRHPMVQVAQ